MDMVLLLVSITGDSNTVSVSTFDHTSYPHCMADMSLPEYNTRFVYLIVSVKRPLFIYICETRCIIDWLRAHTSGNGSDSTTLIKLRPYHLVAHICGFDRNKTLRYSIESQWKYETQR